MGTNTMALIQTCQIQAIMTVPHRLRFSAQLSNCNLATCWHIELSILGLVHLSISIHLSNKFSCSIKFFLGLALGESCVACATTEKHWFPLVIPNFVRYSYDNSFAPALGGACAMGTNTMALIQTCQIQAIMTVPQRLCFSAQLSNCNLATCWHIELSILGLLHLSISIHLGNSFSCSMKFFLGLALGESCVACATTEKHWCPQRHASVGRLS